MLADESLEIFMQLIQVKHLNLDLLKQITSYLGLYSSNFPGKIISYTKVIIESIANCGNTHLIKLLYNLCRENSHITFVYPFIKNLIDFLKLFIITHSSSEKEKSDFSNIEINYLFDIIYMISSRNPRVSF